MSSATLIKEHNLKIITDYQYSSTPAPEIYEFYKEKFGAAVGLSDGCTPFQIMLTYNTPKCDIGCKIHISGKSYTVVKNQAGQYIYVQYAGKGSLASERLIDFDVFLKINELKKQELENIRNKKRETIKTPRDAVRHIVQELGFIEGQDYSLINGNPRFNCAFFSLEIQTPSAKINLTLLWRDATRGAYQQEEILAELNLGDPDFNAKLNKLIRNALNAKN